MAVIKVSTYAPSLEVNINLSVVMPDNIKNAKDINVLFLLHGYNGNHDDYLNYSNVTRYVRDKPVALIMAGVNNSFYRNMTHGFNYFDFLIKDLPTIAENLFNLELTKDNTYIAGLSMGGYGALKAAFTYPDKYRGVASMSGAVDVNRFAKGPKQPNLLDGVFGLDREVLEEDDLFKLSTKVDLKDLDILLTCGTDDFLYDNNLALEKHFTQNKIDAKFIFNEGGHSWDYWDHNIKIIINHFF